MYIGIKGDKASMLITVFGDIPKDDAERSGQPRVADITYGRLQEEIVFLAVILDAYSRRVIAGR